LILAGHSGKEASGYADYNNRLEKEVYFLNLFPILEPLRDTCRGSF